MTIKIEDINFIYLNCKKDKDRKTYFLKQWNDTCKDYGSNIKIDRFDAIHYDDLIFSHFNDYYDIPENSTIKEEPPNIAVFKSHQAIYKRIIDYNLKYAMIFEDDVIIPKDFLKNLEKIISDIPNQWDILFMGLLRPKVKKLENSNWLKLLPLKGYNNGFHAYLINQENIRKIYKCIIKNGLKNQIDIFFRDHANKFNFFVYKELLIKQNVNDFQSTRLDRFVRDELKKNFDEYNIVNS